MCKGHYRNPQMSVRIAKRLARWNNFFHHTRRPMGCSWTKEEPSGPLGPGGLGCRRAQDFRNGGRGARYEGIMATSVGEDSDQHSAAEQREAFLTLLRVTPAKLMRLRILEFRWLPGGGLLQVPLSLRQLLQHDQLGCLHPPPLRCHPWNIW